MREGREGEGKVYEREERQTDRHIDIQTHRKGEMREGREGLRRKGVREGRKTQTDRQTG